MGLTWCQRLCLLLALLPVVHSAYTCFENTPTGHDWVLFEEEIQPFPRRALYGPREKPGPQRSLHNAEMGEFLQRFGKRYEEYLMCVSHLNAKNQKIAKFLLLKTGKSVTIDDELISFTCMSADTAMKDYVNDFAQHLDDPDFEGPPTAFSESVNLYAWILLSSFGVSYNHAWCLHMRDRAAFRVSDDIWTGSYNLPSEIIEVVGELDSDYCFTGYKLRFSVPCEKCSESSCSLDDHGRRVSDIIPRHEISFDHVIECTELAMQNSIGFHSSGPNNGVSDDDMRTLELGCAMGNNDKVFGRCDSASDFYTRVVALEVCRHFANPKHVHWKVTLGAVFDTALRAFVRTPSDSVEPKWYDNLSGDAEALVCRDFVLHFREMVQYLKSNGLQFGPPTLITIAHNVLAEMRILVPQLGSSRPCPQAKKEPSIITHNPLYNRDLDGLRMCAVLVKQLPFEWTSRLRLSEYLSTQSLEAGVNNDAPPSASTFAIDLETEDLYDRLQRNSDHVVVSVEDTQEDFLTRVEGGVVKEKPPSNPPSSGNSFYSSSAASSALLMSSTYASLRKIEGLERKLPLIAEWLEDRLGIIGHFVAKRSIDLVAKVLEIAEWVMSRAIVYQARLAGVCSADMSEIECVCNVVEPMVKIVNQIVNSDPRENEFGLEVSNAKAVTLLLNAGVGYNFFGTSATPGLSGGIYIEVQYSPSWRFEIGCNGAVTSTLTVGTSRISAGMHKELKIGIFFGLRSQLSSWTKGISFGGSFFVGFRFGIDLLFKNSKFGDGECVVHRSHGGDDNYDAGRAGGLRNLLQLPVNWKCIRGFYITISAEVSTTPTINVNVNTAVNFGGHVGLLSVTRDGVQSELVSKIRDVSSVVTDRRGALSHQASNVLI